MRHKPGKGVRERGSVYLCVQVGDVFACQENDLAPLYIYRGHEGRVADRYERARSPIERASRENPVVSRIRRPE